MTDPIVKEVREARMAHTLEFKGDLNLICEDLKRIQKESGHKVIRLEPKRIQTTMQIQ